MPLGRQRLGGEQGGVALLSRPAVMISHVPELPPSQRRQGSVQALAQQTPSAQNPEAQAAADEQAAPLGDLATQVPSGPEQVDPAVQVMLWQHRLSVQKPLWQAEPAVQVEPWASLVAQVPPAQ